MSRRSLSLLLPLLLSLLLPLGHAAAQERGRGFGAQVGIGLSGSPLGQVAERNGMYAVPGTEYEARVLFERTPGREWSVGVLSDRYEMDQTLVIDSRSRFEYASDGLLVGYSITEHAGPVPMAYGVELGWTHFQAESSTPNYYTGEQEDTRTRGDAAVVGVSYGVAIPLGPLSLVPRVRLATNYPDFGGGEGFSALHRTNGLGFKLSFGLTLKTLASIPRE